MPVLDGVGAIFNARANRAPLLVTAGQQARSILPFEPFLFSEQAAQLPKPYVKWSVEPARAANVPAAIARAYYVSMQPPRGPTLVSVPVDDWDRPCVPVAGRRDPLAGEEALGLPGMRGPSVPSGREPVSMSCWFGV